MRKNPGRKSNREMGTGKFKGSHGRRKGVEGKPPLWASAEAIKQGKLIDPAKVKHK